MFDWIKSKFDYSEEEMRRDLEEAEARASKYMQLLEEAEAQGDERKVRKYEKEFMKACNDAKLIRKYGLKEEW